MGRRQVVNIFRLVLPEKAQKQKSPGPSDRHSRSAGGTGPPWMFAPCLS